MFLFSVVNTTYDNNEMMMSYLAAMLNGLIIHVDIFVASVLMGVFVLIFLFVGSHQNGFLVASDSKIKFKIISYEGCPEVWQRVLYPSKGLEPHENLMLLEQRYTYSKLLKGNPNYRIKSQASWENVDILTCGVSIFGSVCVHISILGKPSKYGFPLASDSMRELGKGALSPSKVDNFDQRSFFIRPTTPLEYNVSKERIEQKIKKHINVKGQS